MQRAIGKFVWPLVLFLAVFYLSALESNFFAAELRWPHQWFLPQLLMVLVVTTRSATVGPHRKTWAWTLALATAGTLLLAYTSSSAGALRQVADFSGLVVLSSIIFACASVRDDHWASRYSSPLLKVVAILPVLLTGAGYLVATAPSWPWHLGIQIFVVAWVAAGALVWVQQASPVVHLPTSAPRYQPN